MKKITTIFLALMTLLFTQCKKENIDNNENNHDTRKVKVRCEIPLGDGNKSDFTNLMTDGSIKWSTGTERIYLAVHHETKAQIVELTAETTLSATILAFEGEVDENILTDGATYNVWYFGNSMNLETPYVTKNETDGIIKTISGSIATQSGRLSDLGYHHIAKAEVTATGSSDGNFTLPLHGTLQNKIAIAYMDLTEIRELAGEAIVGTDYTLEYTNGEYKFVINNENNEISIAGENTDLSKSFVVLLPNETTNVDITSNYKKYTFKDGIAAGGLYYRYISDVEQETLRMEWMEGCGETSGHIYVDLGLPSKMKWATCNVGANYPEDYGDYFAWGETTPKSEYTVNNALYYSDYTIQELQEDGIIDVNNNLSPFYDAATYNWGGSWRIPKSAEFQELLYLCTWEWTQVNGVNGYKVTGTNGNHIFFPAAGARYVDVTDGAGVKLRYWTSNPNDGGSANGLANDGEGSLIVGSLMRYFGIIVRPVLRSY